MSDLEEKTITNELNLKSFPFIKLIAAFLLIIGGILAYIFASTPQTKLFQIGGVDLNLIYGIPPLLSGVILLIYAFITYYEVIIIDKGGHLIIKGRRLETSIKKANIKLVKVRNAGKGFVWFVFFFITFFFVYYGLECGIFFTANHNAGLLEYILIPMLLIWFGGLILVLFPRKLITILTKDRAILQKVNYFRNDQSFATLWDQIFGWPSKEEGEYVKTNRYLYRFSLGIVFLLIFSLSNIIVQKEGIYQPLHDLGIFIPMFLLLFGILMIASSISTGINQNLEVNENHLRLEEKTLISSLTGKNYLWIKAKSKLNIKEILKPSFRSLTTYQYLLIFILFGQAVFLSFKFIWEPAVYLKHLNGWDIFIGIVMLLDLVFYEFEIVTKLDIEINTKFKDTREAIVSNNHMTRIGSKSDSLLQSLKKMFKQYKYNFKKLLNTKFKSRILKVGIIYILAILVITLTFSVMGFVFFLFI